MKKNANGTGSKKRIANTRNARNSNGFRQNWKPPETSVHELEKEQAIQRYIELYDFAPTGYVSFDRSGRIAEINLTAVNSFFGIPRERLIGMPFAVLVCREDTPLFLHHLLRCRSQHDHVETELRLKDKNGRMIHVELRSMPIDAMEKDGAMLFQTSIVDLTERKKAEAAIREKEAELELIVTQTPFMLIRCTRDLRYRYVSRAYAELMGRKQQDLAGKPIVEFLGKYGLEKIRPYVERVLLGETVSYEQLVPSRNGQHFLTATYVPDKNESGEVIGWFASILDITERKKAEDRFRMAVEAAPSGMIMVDQNRKIMLVNSQAERLFGYTRKELLGKSVDLLMPERFAGEIAVLSRARTLGRELLGLRKEGTEVAIEVKLNRIKIDEKRLVLASIVDVTERKKAQEKIAEAARQQTSLYQLSQRSQNAKSLHEVYAAALEGITSALHTDRASILLFDSKQRMRFVAWRGISSTYRKAVVGHSPWKPGTKNPKPVCIADMRLADISTSLKHTMRCEDIRAVAFIPLVIGGTLIGKFMIYYRGPHVFTHSELDLAITVARQLTQAIEHQKDEKAIRERERQLARELLDQKHLQRISSQLIEKQDIETIYTQIVEATVALLRSDCGSMQMVLPKTDELLLLAHKGFDPGSASGLQRIPRNSGTSCAEAFRNGERVIVPDLEQCSFVKKEELASYRRAGIRSVQSTPLVSRAGDLVGMISNHWRTVHKPSKRELRLLDVLGRQAADLIEWKRADEEVRESEARMRATVEQATAGVARGDVNGRIIFVNEKFCQMLGYTESELIGKVAADLTHPEDLQRTAVRFEQLIKDGTPFEIEKRYIRKNRSILWADVSVGAVRGADGKTQSTVAVVVDVTARKEAETALQKSNEMLEQRVRERTHELHLTNKRLHSEIERRKGLEGEILSVSDREQQRLGQELHDGLCQHLTAVAFMTRSIALRLRDHRVVDADDIEKVAELVNKAAVDTRNLSRALHRVDVDAAGLFVALQDLADREIWRTACRLEAKPSFRIDDDAAAAHLYRIAREAVINANKHAQARQIVVRLERVRKEMVLRVIDNGIGLPKDLKPQEGLGFHIMNYRAQLMGGRLEIDSPQNGGTRVSCYLPVHPSGSLKFPNAGLPAVTGDPNLRHLTRQGAANA